MEKKKKTENEELGSYMSKQFHYLASIYSNGTKTVLRKDICVPKFIAELFTGAKIWK